MKSLKSIVLILSLLWPVLQGTVQATPSKPADSDQQRRIIIDADTGNEIDDLYAIVRALVEPSFRVKAVCSAHYHTQKGAPDNTVRISQDLNEKILELMNHRDIPHPLGANQPLPDTATPRLSDAAQTIITTAHSMKNGEKLDIAVFGPMTNVASAILMDSTIIEKIRVHAMGLLYDAASKTWDKNEFNTNNDIHAMNLLLNTAGLDLDVMTATASRRLLFYKQVVEEHLKGKGGIWDFLVTRWDDYLLVKTWSSPMANEKQWIMWDIAIIEAMAHPETAIKKEVLTPPENQQRLINVYTEIDAAAMQENFWAALAKAMQ